MKKKLYRRKLFSFSLVIIFLLAVFLGIMFYFRTPLLITFFGKKAYPTVIVSGTWEEMGYQIGSRMEFAKDIRRTAGFAQMLFPPDKAKSYLNKVESLIPQSSLEQMQGFAKGMSDALDISYEDAWEDVIELNFAYMESCTAFAINSPGGLFLTHNTDDYYLLTLKGSVIIFNPNQGLGYPFVSFGSAVFGGVTMGENLAGLAVVYNAAFPSNKCLGLPPPIMIKKVIQECGSIEEAIQVFQSFIDGGGCFGYMGGNVTLIDFKTGEMARLELASDRVEVDHGTKWRNNRFVISTNHYRLMPERNQRKDHNTSSYARYERTLMLLKTGEDFSVEKIIKILSDHDGKKRGTNHTICRHKNLNLGTSNCLFFDDQFILYYILGNPCQYWEDPTTLQKVKWREMLNQN